MALYHFLRNHRGKLGFEFACCHINHQLRGQEADQDAQFCLDRCQADSIPIYIESFPVLDYASDYKLTVEQAARLVRYQRINDMATRYGYPVVITAHHADDNVETVLYRLLSGSSLRAISGIEGHSRLFCNPDIITLRPMLDIWRWEINKYLQKNQLMFCQDSSNNDNRFSRNYIRNELIPSLQQQLNSGLKKTVLGLAQTAREDDQFIYNLVATYPGPIETSPMQLTVDLSVSPAEPALLKRYLLHHTTQWAPEIPIFSHATLNQISPLILNSSKPFQIELKHGHQAIRRKKHLFIKNNML